MKAILGLKKGMTQIFGKDGNVIVCTIIDVTDVKVVGKRTKEVDGYEAVVLGIGKKKKPTKSEVGKYKSLKYVPKTAFEFKDFVNLEDLKLGDEVKADIFEVGDKVDASAVTKGKGFQGVVKRWGFHGGSRTHGQSDRERAPGSIGGGTDPGRVFKGKKMPGHMGAKIKTVLNLEVVKVNKEDSLLCLKGAVPGHKNTVVKVYGGR